MVNFQLLIENNGTIQNVNFQLLIEEQWYDTERSHETNGGLRVTLSDSATCRLGPQSVLHSRTTTSSLVIPGTKKMTTPSMLKGQNMACKAKQLNKCSK